MKVLVRIALCMMVALGSCPLLLALLSPEASRRDSAAFTPWLAVAVFGSLFVMRGAGELACGRARCAR